MRHLCLSTLAAAVIVATPALGAEPTGVIDSAHTLAQACRTMERSAQAAGRKTQTRVTADTVLCLGYMQAMQDLAVLTDENRQGLLGSCPAAATTLDDLIHAFLDYSRAHADRPDGNAALAVIRSFQLAYPCPAIGETARTPESSLDLTSTK